MAHDYKIVLNNHENECVCCFCIQFNDFIEKDLKNVYLLSEAGKVDCYHRNMVLLASKFDRKKLAFKQKIFAK